MDSKLAVVTGAAQGIGRETARALAEVGYELVLHDLREPVETLAELRIHSTQALAVTGDVSSQADVEALAREISMRYGRVDVLVNNAGISSIAAAEETTPEEWRRVIEVNLTGPFLLCRTIGATMLQAGQGSIVNVASIAALAGIADRVAYNASKHGLLGLTRTLAAEWGAVFASMPLVPAGSKQKWTWQTRVVARTPIGIPPNACHKLALPPRLTCGRDRVPGRSRTQRFRQRRCASGRRRLAGRCRLERHSSAPP